MNKALKKELAGKDVEISTLNNKVTELEKDVYGAENEIQSLTAKLSVARQAAAAPQVPGSAVKQKTHNRDLPHMNGHGKLGTVNKALKKELAGKDFEISTLNNKVTEPEKDVYAAEKEIQSLTAKLSVARQAAAAPQVPRSAVKQKTQS